MKLDFGLVIFYRLSGTADCVTGGADIFAHAGNGIAGRQQGHSGQSNEGEFFHLKLLIV